MVSIACVVEGYGEVEAVPILVRRIASEVAPSVPIHVPRPIRVPRQKLVKDGEMERAARLAAHQVSGNGGLLVVIDSNSDCPAELGPDLQQRASIVRPGLMVSVVLAKQEFEAWFLAAAASLRQKRRLPIDLDRPADPELIKSPKSWLSKKMPRNAPYSETIDQPALTGLLDLSQARTAPSFDKCYREVVRLITALKSP